MVLKKWLYAFFSSRDINTDLKGQQKLQKYQTVIRTTTTDRAAYFRRREEAFKKMKENANFVFEPSPEGQLLRKQKNRS